MVAIESCALRRWRYVRILVLVLFWTGCAPQKVEPVDLFPEDACALCRMALSDRRFVAEIVAQEGEVFKFDDIGCLESFRSQRPDLAVAGVFYMDYETRTWVAGSEAMVVATSLSTPMGSGKVAFADSSRGRAFARQHPPDSEAH